MPEPPNKYRMSPTILIPWPYLGAGAELILKVDRFDQDLADNEYERKSYWPRLPVMKNCCH